MILSGQLTTAQHKSHVSLQFDVPPGTTRSIGQFRASPGREPGQMFDNMVCLCLYGPDGARGVRHNNPVRDFVIEAAQATPGYLPGHIEPGTWTLSLDCFRLLGPVDYHLEITCERAATPCKVALVGRVRGWCRGDLHAHTLHSDGRWDVPDLIAWAHQRKLDFVSLTGHNAVAGHAELRSLANDDLLTMGGLELTTHWGHALSLGGGDWHEWRAGAATGKTAVSQSTDQRQVAARDDDAAAAVGKLVREMFDSASADLFKSIFHVKLQQGARMGFGHQGCKVL